MPVLDNTKIREERSKNIKASQVNILITMDQMYNVRLVASSDKPTQD